MISFGFTLGKLGQVLASAKVTLAFGRESDVKRVAYFRSNERRRHHGPGPEQDRSGRLYRQG